MSCPPSVLVVLIFEVFGWEVRTADFGGKYGARGGNRPMGESNVELR